MWNIDLVARAWTISAKAHDGQKYGGPATGEQIEYLQHIGSVTMEVMQALQHHPQANADLAVLCAILHDTVEDTPVTLAQIAGQFGDPVAAGVAALTKNKNAGDKTAQMLDSLQRIKAQPREVWMVKMADRITNLYHPPYYWDADKIKAYRQEAQLIYEHLHPASDFLAQRLQHKITAYLDFLPGATPS